MCFRLPSRETQRLRFMLLSYFVDRFFYFFAVDSRVKFGLFFSFFFSFWFRLCDLLPSIVCFFFKLFLQSWFRSMFQHSKVRSRLWFCIIALVSFWSLTLYHALPSLLIALDCGFGFSDLKLGWHYIVRMSVLLRFSSVLKLGTFPLTRYFVFVKFLFTVEIWLQRPGHSAWWRLLMKLIELVQRTLCLLIQNPEISCGELLK